MTDIVIALNRYAAIEGRVVDSDGEPLAGINVYAEWTADPRTYFNGFTNANGEYTMRAVPEEYTIHFSRLILCSCYNNEFYNSQAVGGHPGNDGRPDWDDAHRH